MEDNIKIILKETGYDFLDWIHLAQDRVEWRAVLNTLINFQFLYKKGNFLVAERLSASQGLRSLELLLVHAEGRQSSGLITVP
jgi:hypothetical protein